MTKLAMTTTDPLIMKVRKVLRSIEPRPEPTEKVRNDYGFDCWVCPICGALCLIRGRAKFMNYNMHFASMHKTPFWKEKQLIKLLARHKGE